MLVERRSVGELLCLRIVVPSLLLSARFISRAEKVVLES